MVMWRNNPASLPRHNFGLDNEITAGNRFEIKTANGKEQMT
jgi:hypothetical protein